MEKSLRDLISRLPIPGLKESTDRHVIAEVLSRELSIPIKPNQIVNKDGIITVAAPPVVKSALRIRQNELLEKLAQKDISTQRFR